MASRTRDGTLVVGGAALTLVILLVLQSLLGSGLLSTRTSTTTVTVLGGTESYNEVLSAYTGHLSALASRNVSALLDEYESNATVVFTGQSTGLNGNHTGTESLSRLFGLFPGDMVNLTLSSQDSPVIGVEGGRVTAASTFNWNGFSTRDGFVSGEVVDQVSYAGVNGTWRIIAETWNWLQFDCQYPGCSGP